MQDLSTSQFTAGYQRRQHAVLMLVLAGMVQGWMTIKDGMIMTGLSQQDLLHAKRDYLDDVA